VNIGRDGLEASDHWATPPELYEKLDAEFQFDFDPCPLNSPFDGLDPETKWGKSNFVNPPYNRADKPRFIKRAYDEWRAGATTVLLIPAAVSTKQFHEIILPNAEIRFIRGRVAFIGTNTKGEKVNNKRGKHDSMIVIFRKITMPKIDAVKIEAGFVFAMARLRGHTNVAAHCGMDISDEISDIAEYIRLQEMKIRRAIY